MSKALRRKPNGPLAEHWECQRQLSADSWRRPTNARPAHRPNMPAITLAEFEGWFEDTMAFSGIRRQRDIF